MKFVYEDGLALNDRERRGLQQELDRRRSVARKSKEGFDETKTVVFVRKRFDGIFMSASMGIPKGSNRMWFITLSDIHQAVAEEDLAAGQSGFSAFCYPWSVIENNLLFHLLLYFDRVYFLRPDETDLVYWPPGTCTGVERYAWECSDPRVVLQRFYGMSSSYLESLEKTASQLVRKIIGFFEDTLWLQREGSLIPLSPRLNSRKKILPAIHSDLADPEFRRLVVESGIHPFFIGDSKRLHISRHGKKTNVLDIQKADYELFFSGRDSIFSDRYFHYGLQLVDPCYGLSVLLSHAMITAERFHIVPVTAEQLGAALLRRKFSRAEQSRLIADYRKELSIKSDFAAMRTLEVSLPLLEFDSFEELMEVKEQLCEELSQFREVMRMYAAAIAESPWDSTFEKRLEEIVAGKIMPAIKNLRARIESSRRAIIRRVARNMKLGAVPIVATIFAGLPIMAVLALSTGVVALEALWEYQEELKNYKQNGLSFVVSVRREISKIEKRR